ncbi:vWA domain-containing protein [Vagococcus humatus]|uniref:VWFA domain-containing protein n=1 Tax=Vagococcus humatus TaxID=1889241 RepID=A0A3S0GDI4_9ENTE|nr:vWA domain-containing protein [Vagococcus humatus]RST89356.1 hypothetical protein C7P63_06165 [Vagococcus humatus]
MDKLTSWWDEAPLKITSQKNCEEFLQRQERSLATFTQNGQLNYLPQADRDRIKFDPKTNLVYLPLSRFLDKELDGNQMLWHIYYELSLYPDWKKYPKAYLNRLDYWQQEANFMVAYLLHALNQSNFPEDKETKTLLAINHVQQEFTQFFYTCDHYLAFLRVAELCPIYQQPQYKEYIQSYLHTQGKKTGTITKLPLHQGFVQSFIVLEIEGLNYISLDTVHNPFDAVVFQQPYASFIQTKMKQLVANEADLFQKDAFLKSFVYPFFKKLWQQEIDQMTLSSNKKSNTKQGVLEKSLSLTKDSNDVTADSLEATPAEEKEILEQLLEQESNAKELLQQQMKGIGSLSNYDITVADQQLFHYYEQAVKKERQEMALFWQKVVGEAKKEQSVKQAAQVKGKLDVGSLIQHYTDFSEAQQTGQYKQLPIFSRYVLTPKENILPEIIEISFVLDNSGSMNTEKIEAARKALTATLLSLEDFNTYLQKNANLLHNRLTVTSETWLFGSQFTQLKSFDSPSPKEQQSELIKSVISLKGQGGATDDASCLEAILDSITPKQEHDLARHKQVKLIFEITDGASSFPGATKTAIEKLLDKQVEMFAFQIGNNNEQVEKTFDFIWNQGFKEPHGIRLGEEIDTLPDKLLASVKKHIETIFTY